MRAIRYAGVCLGLLLCKAPAVLGADQVTLIGEYEKKMCKEGKKKELYFRVPADRQLLFEVEGPIKLVVLVRGLRDGQVDFKLQLDEDLTAETRLQLLRRVSKGIFIQTPAGKHRYTIQAQSDIFARTKILKIIPKAHQPAIPFVKAAALQPSPKMDDMAMKTQQAAPKPESIQAASVPDAGSFKVDSAKVKKIAGKETDPIKPLSTEIYQSRPVEIRLRMLADSMAEAFKNMPGQGRYERLLVARFEQRGPTAEDKEMGALISAQLNTYLKRDHGFYLIERERLGDVLKEIEMSMTGLLDPGKVAELGKMAGAQAMVVGSVSEMGADFSINARVISVETAEVLVAQSVTIPRKGLIALSEESVVLRTRSGAVFRSLVVPGWGQFYNQQPVKGAVLIGLEAALAGSAVALHLLGKKDEDAYMSSSFAQDYPGLTPQQLAQKASELKESANDHYQARNILIYAAVGVWLYNLLDSYLFGVDGSASHMLELNPVVGTETGGQRKWGLALGWRF